jgi:hypothetical protein
MKTAFMTAILFCAVGAGRVVAQDTSNNLERVGRLWTEYGALGSKEQRAFMSSLTADDLFAFTLAAIPARVREHFRGKKVDFADLQVEETCGMFGGDVLEKWGERRLADGRRLTASAMIGLLEDSKLPPEWRSSLRGYLRVMLFANPGRPPSDAREIGLTDQEISALKAHLKKTSKGDPEQLH